MRTHTRAALAGLVLVASGLAGCGSDNGGDNGGANGQENGGTDEQGTGLLQAMSSVQENEQTRGYFAYTALATVNRVGGDRPWVRYGSVQVGLGDLVASAQRLPDTMGFDPLRAEQAFVAGTSPEDVGWLTGSWDTAAIDERIDAAGGSREDSGDGSLWVFGEPSVELSAKLGLLGVGAVQVSSTSLGYATDADHMRWVTEPGNDTLADSQPHRAVAECLGDVAGALIIDQTQAAGVRLVGIGVRIESAEEHVDVLCVAGASADAANGVVEAVSQNAATGETPETGVPWSDIVGEAEVETLGGEEHVVRAVFAPVSAEGTVGNLMRTWPVGDLDGLLATT